MYKNILIALFAFSTTAFAFLALKSGPTQSEADQNTPAQHALVATAIKSTQAATSQAAALKTELEQTAQENKRLDALVRELRGEISILQAGRSPGPGAQRGAGNPPLPVSRAILNELLAKPETVKLAMDWIKADLAPRYASLIALQTQLTDDQREQLRTLLAERYATRMDLAAAGTASLTPELRAQLDADYHAQLVQLVGADGAALFEKSEVKPVSWDRMQRLDERLRYEATPLNQQQYSALWPIVSEAVFYYKLPTDDAEVDALIQQRIAGNQKALAQAGALLTPGQLATLSRLNDDDLATWRVQLYTMERLAQQRSRAPAAPAAPPTPR
jgi:hypothetical protein